MRARLEEERKVREESQRKAREDAERERKESEERAKRESDELRAKLEEERKAREESERKAREEAERRAREDAARDAKDQAEREAREHAEREAKERAEREVKEHAEREAKEHAEREAKEHAERVRLESEARARKEAEEQATLQAEAQARQEAEDKLRLEAEGRAQREAQERSEAEANRVEDERRREDQEAKAKAKVKASEDEEAQRQERQSPAAEPDHAAWEREHAEAQALFAAQHAETERHFADMEKELEAEEAAAGAGGARPGPAPEASRESVEPDRTAAAVRPARADSASRGTQAKSEFEGVQAAYRAPLRWGKPVALAMFALLVLVLVLIHFVSFDGYIPQFEKLAGEKLQQPVQIKALHLSLLPTPHWRMDGVSAGKEGQFVAERINAVTELGSMFSDKKAFTSIEIVSPVLSEQGMVALLFGKPQGQDFKVASLSVKNGTLASETIALPALDAKIVFGEDGAWKSIALETPDRKTTLLLEPKGEGAQIEMQTNVFSTPFGPAFLLENFSAKGTLGRDELNLAEFKGGIHGGYLSGSVNLKWGADWSMGGEVSARGMDPGRFVPALLEEGTFEGKASYAMRAKSYEELFAAPRLDGSFTILKGTLIGVDLARLLQGGGMGGKTTFAELSGNFVRDGGRSQVSQLRLSAGPVTASGSAEADARKNVSGRFGVELKSSVVQARASLALSGSLREPRFSR